MDSVKVIAGGANFTGDVWSDMVEWKKAGPVKELPHKVLPHGAVTTLAGTGSEFSGTAMILNDELEYPVKKGMNHPDFCFDFVIANPELLYTLPPKQTAAGAMDIISHAMENYFTNAEDSYIIDGVLETVIRTVMKEGKAAIEKPDDYDARANLLLASFMAMSGIYLPATPGDWAVHDIENPITNLYGGTHGVNLGILTIAWLKYSHGRDIPKFEQWAVNCMGAKRDIYDPEKTISDGIDIFEGWLRKMGLPTHFSEIGIGPERFEESAELGLHVLGFQGREGYIGRITKLTFDQVMDIYNLAL